MKKLLLSSLALAACMGMYAEVPTSCYVIGNVNGLGWNPTLGVEMTQVESGVFKAENVVVDDDWNGNGWFGFTSVLSTDESDWATMEAARIGALNNDDVFSTTEGNAFLLNKNAWQLPAGTYTFYVNYNTNLAGSTFDATLSDGGDVTPEPGPGPVIGEGLYLIGSPTGWSNSSEQYPLTLVQEGIYTASFEFEAGELMFRFFPASSLGNWDDNIQYGANEANDDNLTVELTDGIYSGPVVKGKGNWTVNWEGGIFNIAVNLNSMSIEFGSGEVAGVKKLNAANNGEEVIYNLQGVRVNRANLTPGIYVVNGKKMVIR